MVRWSSPAVFKNKRSAWCLHCIAIHLCLRTHGICALNTKACSHRTQLAGHILLNNLITTAVLQQMEQKQQLLWFFPPQHTKRSDTFLVDHQNRNLIWNDGNWQVYIVLEGSYTQHFKNPTNAIQIHHPLILENNSVIKGFRRIKILHIHEHSVNDNGYYWH